MAIFGPPDPAKLEASGDVSGLIKALGYEKDASVRAAAAGSLGRIGDCEQDIGRAVVFLVGVTVGMLVASAPAVGTGFDQTVNNTSDLQAKWSIANAANSITVHTYALWALNMN